MAINSSSVLLAPSPLSAPPYRNHPAIHIGSSVMLLQGSGFCSPSFILFSFCTFGLSDAHCLRLHLLIESSVCSNLLLNLLVKFPLWLLYFAPVFFPKQLFQRLHSLLICSLKSLILNLWSARVLTEISWNLRNLENKQEQREGDKDRETGTESGRHRQIY